MPSNQFGVFNLWTENELTILQREYPKKGSNIPELFIRDKLSIQNKAHILGVRTEKNKWSKEEITFLIEKYPEQGTNIQELLKNKKRHSIKSMAQRLNIKYIGDLWFLKELDILKKEYPEKGTKIYELLKRHSNHSIQHKAIELGLKWNGFGKRIDITDEIKEIIDGLLLGDGGFSGNGFTADLRILQREDKRGVLEDIQKRLETFGITSKINWHRKEEEHKIINGKKTVGRPSVVLRTPSYIDFELESKKWRDMNKSYKKIQIPEDISITPLTLALWYMGDGYLVGGIDKREKNRPIRYKLSIATDCFLVGLNKFKEKLEEKYGWRIIINSRNRICLNYQKDILNFLRITEPYIVSCFEYKWRALNDKIWLKKNKTIIVD